MLFIILDFFFSYNIIWFILDRFQVFHLNDHHQSIRLQIIIFPTCIIRQPFFYFHIPVTLIFFLRFAIEVKYFVQDMTTLLHSSSFLK